MKRLCLRVPIWVAWGAGVAALGAFVWWVTDAFTARENVAIEWALRLPKERERARKAGFIRADRVTPQADPAKNAGADWVRLDAVLRADSPDGKLPAMRETFRYISPRTRAKANGPTVRALWRKHRALLPDAEHASRKPLCCLPYRWGETDLEGTDAALFLAALHLVSALEARKQGQMRQAVDHAATALRISRQLQAQEELSASGLGFSLEMVVLRFVRQGLIARDEGARTAWRQALIKSKAVFLESPRNEPPALTQFTRLLHSDYRLIQEFVQKERKKKYKPEKALFMESIPVLRLVNRLDFLLGNRLSCDAPEASFTWGVTGLLLRLREYPTDTCPYAVWKATQDWDRYAAKTTKDSPKWLAQEEWADIPLRRVTRDTERALTQAVWQHGMHNKRVVLPDDPSASKPHIPLHRRVRPDGTTVYYSIGADGKDDKGDPAKDRIARVARLTKAD